MTPARMALGGLGGAGEHEVLSSDGDLADGALDAAIVELESAIQEAPSQVGLLVDEVRGCLAEQVLGSDARVHVANPLRELVEQRQRTGYSLAPALGVVQAALSGIRVACFRGSRPGFLEVLA